MSFGGGGPGVGSWVALGDSTPRANWVDIDIDTGIGPAVPEPGSWALLLAGLAMLGFTAARRRGETQAARGSKRRSTPT